MMLATVTTHAHRTSVDARTYRQKAFVRQSRIHASSTESSNHLPRLPRSPPSSSRPRRTAIAFNAFIFPTSSDARDVTIVIPTDERRTTRLRMPHSLTRIASHSRQHGVANAGRLSRRRTRQGTHARIDDTTRIRYARDRSATERNGTNELTHFI